MKLLWHGRWRDVPAYGPDSGQGRMVAVEQTIPLTRIRHASGRRFERPGTKVLRFIRTDGPRATYRKAASKRAEDRYSGDYWVVGLDGRCRGSDTRVFAVAVRMPRFAELMPLHRSLCREVAADADFEAFACDLHRARSEIDELGLSQTYLYSNEEPPAELLALLDRATATTAVDPSGAGGGKAPELLTGPGGLGQDGNRMELSPPVERPGQPPVAVLGAGDYVRIEVMPALRRARLNPWILCDREPQIAELTAGEHGFPIATTDAQRAIEELPAPGVVFIATAHDSHASLATLALERGHRVFLEKPAVVTRLDLQRLLSALDGREGRLELGFNRRFNPLLREAARRLGGESGPFTITCTVREVEIERSHWYLWPNQGTRIAGNLCHWIDAAIYLMGGTAAPISVTMSPIVSQLPGGLDSDRMISVDFEDGSLVSLLATDRGDDVRGVQEQIRAIRGSLTLDLDDLWRMRLLRGGKSTTQRTMWRDKGHQRMYRSAFARLRADQPALYPTQDLRLVSAIQLAATELARSGGSRIEVAPFLETGANPAQAATPELRA